MYGKNIPFIWQLFHLPYIITGAKEKFEPQTLKNPITCVFFSFFAALYIYIYIFDTAATVDRRWHHVDLYQPVSATVSTPAACQQHQWVNSFCRGGGGEWGGGGVARLAELFGVLEVVHHSGAKDRVINTLFWQYCCWQCPSILIINPLLCQCGVQRASDLLGLTNFESHHVLLGEGKQRCDWWSSQACYQKPRLD